MSIRNKVTGDLPNITTYTTEGSITDISVTGNVSAGGNLVAAGNVNSENISTNGNVIAGGSLSAGNVSASGNVSAGENVNGAGLTISGNAIITGDANVLGNLTYNDVSTITTSNLVLGLGNNQSGINVTGGGMVVGNTNEASFLYNQPTQSWNSNIAISATGNVSGQYIIGNGAFLTGMAAGYDDLDVSVYLASGNANANIITTANISGSYILGNGSQLTGLPAGYANANVDAYLASNANVTITTIGNVTASKFIGDGNLLTNVIAKTSIVNGNSIAQVYANGNITMSVSNVANVATVTTNSLRVNGNIYDINGQVYGVPANNYYAGFSSTPANVVTGGTIKFNGNYSTYGTGITYNSSTGIFTLQPGTYDLSASLALSNLAGNGELDYVWMNITAGNTYIGSYGGVLTPAIGATNAAWQSQAQAVITTSVVTQVKLYVTFAGAGGSGQQLNYNQSHAFINQIGGQAPITNVASYAKYTRSTQQTTGLTANSVIVCNVSENVAGSDISANTITGQVTLQAGKTYRLVGMLPGFTATGTDVRIGVCWYNETAGSWIGNSADAYNPASAANFGTFGGTAEAVITPQTTTVVSFRLLSVFGPITGLGGNSDFTTIGNYPWIDIQAISGLLPVTVGSSSSTGGSTISATAGNYTAAFNGTGPLYLTLTAATAANITGVATDIWAGASPNVVEFNNKAIGTTETQLDAACFINHTGENWTLVFTDSLGGTYRVFYANVTTGYGVNMIVIEKLV